MIRAALLVLALCAATGAGAACRQALALALDVSGSVDAAEYRMQLDGLAGALDDPGVKTALLAIPAAPVNVMVFEWSGPGYQRILVPWRSIDTTGDLAAITLALRRTSRIEAPPATALGSAMRHGAAALRQRDACWQRTLDISGDGKPNMGPHPRAVRPEMAGITVNALVIGADTRTRGGSRQLELSELSSFFRAYVISGPDSFVQTALGFDEYQAAMIRKLLRELQVPALSVLMSPDNLRRQ